MEGDRLIPPGHAQRVESSVRLVSRVAAGSTLAAAQCGSGQAVTREREKGHQRLYDERRRVDDFVRRHSQPTPSPQSTATPQRTPLVAHTQPHHHTHTSPRTASRAPHRYATVVRNSNLWRRRGRWSGFLLFCTAKPLKPAPSALPLPNLVGCTRQPLPPLPLRTRYNAIAHGETPSVDPTALSAFCRRSRRRCTRKERDGARRGDWRDSLRSSGHQTRPASSTALHGTRPSCVRLSASRHLGGRSANLRLCRTFRCSPMYGRSGASSGMEDRGQQMQPDSDARMSTLSTHCTAAQSC